jgi:hypothetical protein
MNPSTPAPTPESHSTDAPPPLPTPVAPPDGWGSCLEMLLRNPSALAHHLHFHSSPKTVLHLALIALVSLCIFGLVLGLFSRGDQLWAAPLKIAGGMFFSAAICLPSLYIFACLSGVQIRFQSLAGILLGTVALTGVLLLGFAPISWVFSQSTDSVFFFGFLNLAFWFIGLFFGLGFLFRFAGSHSIGHLLVWTAMFILVCLQMTSSLRPLIGRSDTFFPTEKKFFLTHWFENPSTGKPVNRY